MSESRTDEQMNLVNQDGWKNVLTKVGTSKDPQTKDKFGNVQIRDYGELEDIYRGDGLGKRIVELPVGEMTREWFKVEGDTEDAVLGELQNLNAKSLTNKALRWGQVFGGGIIVMLIDDGRQLNEPVDEANIKKVVELRVYDRFRVWWNPTDVETDPNKPFFGVPFQYQVNPTEEAPVNPMFTVHASRVLIFDGEDISDIARRANRGWGDSIYQSAFKQLANAGGAWHSAREILQDFIQPVLSIDNLQELIVAPKGADTVKKRIELVDLSRHMLNMILIDSKEQYDKVASSVSGLDKVIESMTVALAAVTGIPHTLLMGTSPGGLNSTGDADIRFWYDSISSDQEAKMLNQMNYLVKLIMLSSDGPTNGKEIDGWKIIFNPLWQPTEKELAEIRKIQSDTDTNYINTGVLTPEEVAISRFGGATYSTDTVLLPGDRSDNLQGQESIDDSTNTDHDDLMKRYDDIGGK